MAVAKPTLTDYGVFQISGTALKTAVNALGPLNPVLSGSAIYLLPIGQGQINLITIVYD